MSVQIYKNSSWTMPIIKLYKNGAWKDINSIKQYKNGVWVEIYTIKPIASLQSSLVTFVNSSTTYSYTIDANRTAVTCNIQNAVSGDNHVPFIINKPGGFSNTIKLKYTVTQTMTASSLASSRWLKMDYLPMSNELGMWYNYYPCANTTYEGTLTFDKAQQCIYLLFEAYTGNLTSTISNVYINDELVTFK